MVVAKEHRYLGVTSTLLTNEPIHVSQDISLDKNGNYEVWVVTHKYDDPNDADKITSSSKELYTIHKTFKKYKLLYFVEYDSVGNVVKSWSGTKTEFTYIVPGSIMEEISDTVRALWDVKTGKSQIKGGVWYVEH